jgi:hypothetical protein
MISLGYVEGDGWSAELWSDGTWTATFLGRDDPTTAAELELSYRFADYSGPAWGAPLLAIVARDRGGVAYPVPYEYPDTDEQIVY